MHTLIKTAGVGVPSYFRVMGRVARRPFFPPCSQFSPLTARNLRPPTAFCFLPTAFCLFSLHAQGQATWRSSFSSSGGTASAQLGLAMGQRVWNEQPDGLRIGFG